MAGNLDLARSPALVRQGQISEIISAKPQSRRRILEDAAGIAGLHARRHEAVDLLTGRAVVGREGARRAAPEPPKIPPGAPRTPHRAGWPRPSRWPALP